MKRECHCPHIPDTVITCHANADNDALASLVGALTLYPDAVLLFPGSQERQVQDFYEEAVDSPPGTDQVFTVEEGDTVDDVAGRLADQGLIANEFAFIFQSRFYEYDDFYPGTYELNTSMTSKEILQALNVKPQEEEES